MTDALFHPKDLREDVDVEFKRAAGRDGKGAVPKDLWESYSAFANTEGGVIYLGVTEKDDTFVVSGITDPDRVLTDFWNQVNNPQKVSCNLLTDTLVQKMKMRNGRWAIQIEVPRASRQQQPVYINGNPLLGTYRRRFSGDYRCSKEEVQRMLAEQIEDARDARILSGFTLADLNAESLKAYRNRLAALKPDHPYHAADDQEFLQKIGGWRRNRETGEEGMTLAGILMFGNFDAVFEVLPNYFVDYREVPLNGSKTEWTDRLTADGTWSGNLYDFYRMVIQRLFREIKVPFKLAGDEREEDTLLHKALREALVNTIVHADFSARLSILVVKAPDYFGFRNPGRMRIPIELALEGGHSDCRNRYLQRMFSMIGLGEQAGSGIPRVVENWTKLHYRNPELWESQDPESTLMRLRTVSLLPEETLEELTDRLGNRFRQLNEHARMALVTAQIEGFITNKRMQQLCRLHSSEITGLLKSLEEEDFLTHDGQGRGTTYRIAGTPVVDLAERSELLVAPRDRSGDLARSTHVDPERANVASSSPHIEGSSPHRSIPSSPLRPDQDPALIQIAAPVRDSGRVAPHITKQTILQLCDGRFLSAVELGALLKRSSSGLTDRFLKSLVQEEKLERRFPQQPNHEKQAYRTKAS